MYKLCISIFLFFLLCCKNKEVENIQPSATDTIKPVISIKSGYTLDLQTCIVPCEIKPILENINAYNVKWEFGDGLESTEKQPVHYYVFGGLYNIKLTVYNSLGEVINEQNKSIEVKDELIQNDYTIQRVYRNRRDKVGKLIWYDTTSIASDKSGKTIFLRKKDIYNNFSLYKFIYSQDGFVCTRYNPSGYTVFNAKYNEKGRPFLITQQYSGDNDLIYNSNLIFEQVLGYDEYLTTINKIPPKGYSPHYDRFEIHEGNLVKSTHTGGDGLGSVNEFESSNLINNFSNDFFHYIYLTTPGNVGATYDSYVYLNNTKSKYKNLLKSKVLSGPFTINYSYSSENSKPFKIIGSVKEDNSVIEIIIP